MDWFAAFGILHDWVSDRGTHLKNEMVRLLREATRANHFFKLAYCPWSNGTVEVVRREMLRAMRALASEFQLQMNAWPSLVPLIQSALINTILDRLGGRCPLTAFMGLPRDSPLVLITRKVGDTVKVHSIE